MPKKLISHSQEGNVFSLAHQDQNEKDSVVNSPGSIFVTKTGEFLTPTGEDTK
jgi:hypothetical protein